VIFATLVGKNTELSVKAVALSTLLCIMTIPIVLAIVSR
jgi:predicted permease